MLPPVENWKPQKESPKACLLRRLPGRLTESYQMTPARLEAALAGPNPHSTGSLHKAIDSSPYSWTSLVLCGFQPTTRAKVDLPQPEGPAIELSVDGHPSAMMTQLLRNPFALANSPKSDCGKLAPAPTK